MTKNDILTRLLKQGHITVDEMITLSEGDDKIVYVPYVHPVDLPWTQPPYYTTTDFEITHSTNAS